MAGKKRRQVGPTPTKATPPLGPQVEYRHLEDDAWYSVQLLLSGETLTVKFMEFPEDQDQVFNVDEFTTFKQLSDFARLFRPLSLQLDALDCGSLQEGIKVCAITDLGLLGRRYFDAFVEAVKHEEHTIVDEMEECSCSVVVSWLHGPIVGTLTLAKVKDLCLIQSHTHLDPRLACFIELAKWKYDIASPHDNLITEDISSLNGIPTLFLCKRCEYQNLIQKSESRKQVESEVPDGKVLEPCYFILVENLEKDVPPLTITTFIKEEIGLNIEAFVFLNLSSEPYTRGALVVDCVEDLERLCDFVVKSDQMIVSSKGRPWIVTGPSSTEFVRPSFWCLEQDLENENKLSPSNGLKLVKFGSEEYDKAEKLRDLFVDFANHQKNLAKSLALKEQHILDS